MTSLAANLAPGEYTLQVSVYDAGGLSAEGTVTVRVTDSNFAPTLSLPSLPNPNPTTIELVEG